MNVERLIVGELEENTYILSINNNVLIIDPGCSALKIIEKIGNKKVDGILITHRHFDHIGALDYLINYYNTSFYDYSNIKEGKNNINNFNFEVIYNPGHTSDSISFYFYEYEFLFSGDFIFKGTIGRTDLETGNMFDMINSIKKICKYNPKIKIYPGHGDYTYLEDEMKYNYYFNK